MIMRKKLLNSKRRSIKNFKTLTNNMKHCKWQRLSRKMKILSTWRSLKSPILSTRKSCKSYTKKSFSTSRNSCSCWSKTRSWWWNSLMKRSISRQFNTSKLLKLCSRNSKLTCRKCKNVMNRANETRMGWRWSMKRNWTNNRRNKRQRLPYWKKPRLRRLTN